ncbi:imidazole glycerol phosphate synthase subunit HisH [Rhodovarius crocodyli]|uniref:Imidazole glycerol phosphate synthase subunit HisH n=1 Tax=Rhodovarius crocodyli TaxID=1979269 RepID=A0A437MMJ4_9PROT|nr:imidazole glycerol phosphate synthase subunit HisH [Rhodovarius crocodyli]RVT98853.1 imidazole glycerol phosphate synthase subunit HisH [Rhodovarius crocodyli]
MRLAVVDPGSGNLASVHRAVERAAEMAGAAVQVTVTRDPADVAAADRVVLPGQGAFAACRHGLDALPGMEAALNEHIGPRARPLLGICVGMQLFAERGLEHGVTPGLAWLPGEVAPMDPRGPDGKPLPLPQMGWNRLDISQDHALFAGLAPDAHAYFVHSYAWSGGRPEDLLATTDYGGPVTAVVGRANIAGTQFHVEKSGLTGLTILANFLTWSP